MPSFDWISEPSQRSSVSHVVPRTVAELYRDFVLKLPVPLPQSRRTGRSSAARPAARRADWQIEKSPPTSSNCATVPSSE